VFVDGYRYVQCSLLASCQFQHLIRHNDFQFGASFPAGQDPPYKQRVLRAASSHRHIRERESITTVDPEGGAQDAHRFSTRQDAASKNPGHAADGRFASAPKSFLWLLSLRQRK
jgi:hypothetical protein